MLPDGTELEREIVEIDWDEETAEKGGFETFMLKEIHEQADAVAETIADRTVRADGVDLDDVGALDEALLRDVKRIIVVACGTSYHAGLIGRYAIEEWARIPVEMDIASEYRYRNPVVGPGDLVIGITQSGETADTLAAMRIARERGATVLALTNIMGSQATRDADGVLYTRAGLEVCVAATKTFTCQVVVMFLLGLKLAELRGTLPAERRAEIIADLKRIPHCIEELLGSIDAQVHGDRRRALGQGLLPLPRPPRRPAGGARGRAQAQGDLLHLHRRVRGGRDEARPDRAARRVDAGRHRRHRLARAREGRLQHAGGPRPRRARDRHRHRGQRRPSASTPSRSCASRTPTGCCSRCWRSSRCSCWPTASRAGAGSTSTSRATWPRRHGRVATASTWGLAPSRLGSASTRRIARSRTSRLAGSSSQASSAWVSAAAPTAPSIASERGDLEAGRRDLALELVGTVEVGGGEPARVLAGVAVLAVGEVALDDRLEAGLQQEALRDAVERRGEARDRRGGEQPAGAQRAARLVQGAGAVGRLGQVVERPEQEHDVGARVGERQLAGVADDGGGRAARRPGGRRGAGLLDVQRDRVERGAPS